MYLKGVEIYGFKSFGERIKIDFNGGITSIVGPNGSGKSNILDAILWVLGEQSYKNIRAKESKDIIFSGGEQKKSASTAEVSLYIDNKDSFFQINEDTLKITRKIYTSGENEYLINDKKSRLKDISDMFLDTGVGKSAYSVIGQGKVERIISSSKKEVKEIIEEAAGVKKYQIRKNEVEKKLINVSGEVEKIDVLLNEIFDNRGKIKKQAEKALDFLEIKKERDILNKGIYIFDSERNKKFLENSREKILEVLKSKENFEKEKSESEIELNSIALEKEDIKKNIKDIYDSNEELKNMISFFERDKVKLSERKISYEREKEEKFKLINSLQEKMEKNKDENKKFLYEEEELLKNIKYGEEKYIEFEKILEVKNNKKIEIEKKLENDKRSILDFEVMKLQNSNDIENSSKRVKSSINKIENLNKDILAIEEKLKSNEELFIIAEENMKSKTIQLQDTEKAQEECDRNISEISIKINKLQEELRRNEIEEISSRRKYDNILRFEENNEGFYRGVKEILNTKINGVKGALISLINIPEKFEKAIEASIAGNLQDIVVENSDIAKKCINILKEKKVGKASFLALDTIKTFGKKEIPKIEGVLGRGSELINFDKKYQKVIDMVLSNLLIVENIDIAISISRKNLFTGNIVTLEGELISGTGRITGGENKNSAVSQMFERKKESRKLENLLLELTKKISKNRSDQEEYSVKLENLENKTYELDSLRETLRKNFKIYLEEFENLKTRKEKLLKDKNIFISEKSEEENYLKEYENKIKISSEEKLTIEKNLDDIKNIIESNTEVLREMNIEFEKTKDEFADIKIKYLNNKDRKNQIKFDIEKNLNEKLEIEKEILESKARKEILISEIFKIEEKLKEIEKEKEEKNFIFERKNTEFTVLKEKNEYLDIKEKELIIKIKDFESKIYREDEKIRIQKENLVEYNNKLEVLEENLKLIENVELKEIKPEDYKNSYERVKYLTNKLRDFENVNLLAVEEFKELDEKYNFIKSQKEDLEKSKDSLSQIMEELSNDIRHRFFEAFDSINKNFNVMCMETIDNSEGSLVMSNEEDYENCGVEIYVKFKNKKRQSLTLLSGGEKSMVAIAFIMAIFMYKPSPFTFLDEIEAALDEKNTKKLIGKLKQFTDKSQFILITHNKETMKSSDSLFGVTMNKKIGISKIVPVKL